jgi:16S rRNA G1207 methylase RsmC
VEELVDLACGNGVIGLVAYRRGLARNVTFCDESAMAIASARENAARIFPDDAGNLGFFHGDGLRHYPGRPPKLVLCNPPFHDQHNVDAAAGRRLLRQASRILANGGKLCLVANRHLDYASTLRRDFDQVSRLASNRKFIVWLASN